MWCGDLAFRSDFARDWDWLGEGEGEGDDRRDGGEQCEAIVGS